MATSHPFPPDFIESKHRFDHTKNSTYTTTTTAQQQKLLNILFTKVDSTTSKHYAEIVKKLGGCLIDTPQLGDILVCDKVYRTFKFLFALCKGIPIVSSKWIEVSSRNRRFSPTEHYLLLDKDAEKRFNFSLKKSLGEFYSQYNLIRLFHAKK